MERVQSHWLRSAASWLLLILAVLLAWSARTPNSDLYMALAGGRDAAAGKLGTPDDWSFQTEGRIWINQSWLTGRMLYGVWRLGGEAGLIAARSLLLVLMAGGLVGYLRARRFDGAAALAAAAAVMFVCRDFTHLRGNLLTLALTPWLLWLLAMQPRAPRVAAVGAAALLMVWTHLHGGFIFGVAATGLWLVTDGAARLARRSAAAVGWGGWCWMAAAVLVGLVAAPLLSPFGGQVFGASLQMTGQTEWRTIREWQPLIADPRSLIAALSRNFTETGSFLVLLAVAAILRWRTPAAVGASLPPRDAAWTWFDRGLALGAIVMALTGWRFIPLAATALAAPLARYLEAAQRSARVSGAICGGMLVGAIGLAYPMLVLGYSPRHPFHPAETIFERQVGASQLPVGAARFLGAIGVDGGCFHPYSSESYLRWAAPRLKVGCGGRAQQIYSEAQLRERRLIENPRAREPADMAARRAFFVKHDIRVLLFSAADSWDLLLALAEGGEWPAVYYDGEFCVLLRNEGSTAELARDLGGRLRDAGGGMSAEAGSSSAGPYADALTRARSRAMWFASASDLTGPDWAAFRAAAMEAQRLQPDPLLYALLARSARKGGAEFDAAAYFEAEYKRLAGLPAGGPMDAARRLSQRVIARGMSDAARGAGRADEAARWAAAGTEATAELDRLFFWWQF